MSSGPPPPGLDIQETRAAFLRYLRLPLPKVATVSEHPTLPPLKQRWSPNQSRRITPVRLVVVHRPVGSYHSAITVLCDPNHEASAHVVVREDGREATQLVGWGKKAWACAWFNSASDNIETPDWIWTGPMNAEKERVMQVCARIVAFRLHKRELPARYVHPNGRGFIRHYDLGKIGGGHTDPTTDPTRWEHFVALVEAEAARGHFRPRWGVE